MSDPQLLSSMLAKHSASAVAEAIANADAHTSNAGLPTYSELADALCQLGRHASWMVSSQRASCEEAKARANAILSRIPS